MYVVEIDSLERESEAIRHLLGLPLKEQLLGALGLGPLSWIIIEAQKTRLTPDLAGDVDILAGNLNFHDWAQVETTYSEMKAEHPHWPPHIQIQLAGKKISEAGGLVWPPQSSYVVGAEVKCAYFTGRIKAGKPSRQSVKGIRGQIDRLERMGLDKVALVDIVGTNPTDADAGGWLGALGQAQLAREAIDKILRERLPEQSAAGQLIWSVGSVAGGDEGIRGAGGLQLLRAPRDNSRLQINDPETMENRRVLLANIPRLLSVLSRPRYFPVTFVDCRKCRKLHLREDPACPWNLREVA